MTTRSLAAVVLSLALAGCAVATPTDLVGQTWESPAVMAGCRDATITTIEHARRCSDARATFTARGVTIESSTDNNSCPMSRIYSGTYTIDGETLRLTGPLGCEPSTGALDCSNATQRAGAECALVAGLGLRLSRSSDGTLQVRDALGRSWSRVAR